MHDWLMASLHSLTQLSSRLQPDLPKASYLTFDKSEFIRERLQSNVTDRTVPKRKNINELVSMYVIHSDMHTHTYTTCTLMDTFTNTPLPHNAHTERTLILRT